MGKRMRNTHILEILRYGLDLVMGHVLIPILYRVGSTDVRLIASFGSQFREMSVSKAIPLECVCITARDAGKVASSPTSRSVKASSCMHAGYMLDTCSIASCEAR